MVRSFVGWGLADEEGGRLWEKVLMGSEESVKEEKPSKEDDYLLS